MKQDRQFTEDFITAWAKVLAVVRTGDLDKHLCTDTGLHRSRPKKSWSRYKVLPAGGSRVCHDAEAKQMSVKLDVVLGLLENLAREKKAADAGRPIPTAPGVLSPDELMRHTPSVSEMLQENARRYAVNQARACAEAEAAYAARNPHKKKEAQS